jgi:hypothetical protein
MPVNMNIDNIKKCKQLGQNIVIFSEVGGVNNPSPMLVSATVFH